MEVSPDEVIGFGKHKGSTFADIVRDDLGYARWCATVPEASLPLRRLVKYAENQGVIATTNAAAAAAAATARVTAAVAAAAAEGTPVLRRAAPPLARPCQKQAFVDDEPQTGNADCAAFAGYTGSLELELLGAAGFALRPDSRLPSEAWAALCSWPGCTWDRREKCFRFPSGQYKEVCQRLRALDAKAPCQIFFPPSWLLVAMKPFQAFGAVSVPKKTAQALSATPSRPCATLPVLQGREGHALLPYQKEGVEHGLAHGGRILLADEMGLGKTAQALMLASQYPADWPLLVICPSSLRGVWRDEAARWVPAGVVEEPENQIQVIRKGSEQPRPDARLIIVSYDLAAVNVHLCQTAGGENYRFVVCDECHYLKSPTSRRSLSLCPLLKSARRCVLLSGTPATGAAAELYTPLDALLPGLLPTYQEFCSRYCEEQSIHAGRKVLTRFVGSKKRAELNALLEGSVMLRRRKSAVLSQLPAKRRQRVLLEELDAKKMKELKEKVKDGSANATALDGDGGGGHGSLPELFLLTGLAKLKAVQEYVTTLLQAECRFLLFAHHTEVMDGLQNTLEQQKVDFIRIDGRTSARRPDQWHWSESAVLFHGCLRGAALDPWHALPGGGPRASHGTNELRQHPLPHCAGHPGREHVQNLGSETAGHEHRPGREDVDSGGVQGGRACRPFLQRGFATAGEEA